MEKMTAHQKKKVDAKEFMAVLEKLPEEEKFKLFYMVKGIELVSKNEKPSHSA